MDSGAANNVMPRRMVRNKFKIRPSKGSISGVHYIAENNERIPNEGEVDFNIMTAEGNEEEFVFQIAEVNKALGAVSYFVDHDYKVVFDRDAKTGRDMSYMMHKPTNGTRRLRRDRNIWVLDAYAYNEKNSQAGFVRQG